MEIHLNSYFAQAVCQNTVLDNSVWQRLSILHMGICLFRLWPITRYVRFQFSRLIYGGCMCSTGQFEFRYLKEYICVTILLSSNQLDPLFHCCHIFRWAGCVLVVVLLYSTTCICREHWDFVSIIDVQSVVCTNLSDLTWALVLIRRHMSVIVGPVADEIFK